MMTAERLERYAPLTGVLAVVLWVVGFLVLMSSGMPGTTAPPEQVLAYYQRNTAIVLAGGLIFVFGVLAFVWFLGSLRVALHSAEGGAGRLASIAFGGGIAMAISAIFIPAGGMAVALAAGTISATSADALHRLPGIFYVGAEMFAAVVAGATGLAALRTAVLPRWLAWVSVVLAVVLLIPPIGWIGVLIGIPLWVALVSVLLMPSAEISRQEAAALPR
jgi:hypothetical protein